MNREEIIAHLGAENWIMVVNDFFDESLDSVLSVLDKLWPYEDNIELAQSIFDELLYESYDEYDPREESYTIQERNPGFRNW